MPLYLITPTIQDRAQGCMIWAAYGDVLGRETEFKYTLNDIFKSYPHGITVIQNFTTWAVVLPKKFKKDYIAPYTDDTRMTLLMGQGLLKSNNFESAITDVADNFIYDINDALL